MCIRDRYITVVDTIKKEIRSAQYRTAVQANTELLRLYYSIGKEINVHKVWGNKFIENLSMDIRADYPANKGYSVRNLKYMAKFAATYSEQEFVQQAVAQIPWGHNIVLLDKITDSEPVSYTHLDVYKRQVEDFLHRIGAMARDTDGELRPTAA